MLANPRSALLPALLVATLLSACGSQRRAVSDTPTPRSPIMSSTQFQKPSEASCARLTPLQYEVTQHDGHRAAVPQRVLGQPRGRHLRRRRRPASRCSARATSSTRAPAGRASRGRSRTGAVVSNDRPTATAWSAPRCARATATRTWATCSTTGRRRPGRATASTRRRCASSRWSSWRPRATGTVPRRCSGRGRA